MKIIPLTFAFRGQRNYVQGADIYLKMLDALLDIISPIEIGGVSLSMHAFASNQCMMHLLEIGEDLVKPDGTVAELIVKTNEGNFFSWLVETNEPVNESIDYDEYMIQKFCNIEGKEIAIEGDSGYSPIEVTVSMTKELHYHLFPLTESKWIFSKLELKRPLSKNDSQTISIGFKHNFRNQLTKSSIHIGDEFLGYIYFSEIT